MKYLVTCGVTLILMIFCFTTVQSQDFVYRAKNPYFGGDTFNYQWMLNSAQAQDTNKDPDTDDRLNTFTNRNSLDEFSESLNRQILNELSRNIIGNEFGEDGLQEGAYTIGNYQIDVIPSQEGLAVTIVDIVTGGQTQIIVPYY